MGGRADRGAPPKTGPRACPTVVDRPHGVTRGSSRPARRASPSPTRFRPHPALQQGRPLEGWKEGCRGRRRGAPRPCLRRPPWRRRPRWPWRRREGERRPRCRGRRGGRRCGRRQRTARRYRRGKRRRGRGAIAARPGTPRNPKS
ncbi:hypothetical protein T484DRAFT_1915201, partial [Baffinella frigidus]